MRKFIWILAFVFAVSYIQIASANGEEASGKKFQGHFSWALDQLKEGKILYRGRWERKDMWVKIKTPEVNETMTSPYIYMKSVDDEYVPWLPSQFDLMAEDWMCRNCRK